MFPEISPNNRIMQKRNFIIFLTSGFLALLIYTLVKFTPSFNNVKRSSENYSSKTKRDLQNLVVQNKSSIINLNSSPKSSIFTAIQLTDLHLSVFTHPERLQKFQKVTELFTGIKSSSSSSLSKSDYIDSNLPLNLLLITGDLTDGRNNNYYQGQQVELEWILYNNAMKKIQKSSDIKILDLRGNHDVYGSFNSTFYKKYGVSSNSNLDVSRFCSKSDLFCYDFIPLDLVTLPGPTRPLNFMGYLSPKMRDFLQKYNSTDGSNLSIFYGHYPLSTTHDIKQKVEISKKADIYLSGHLHELTNASPAKNLAFPHISNLYAKHNFGGYDLPEYELGDFRDFRRVRIITIDNGLFNFRDFNYLDSESSKLIVMITNPKNSWQAVPGKTAEEFETIQKSEKGHVFVYGLNLTENCLQTLELTEAKNPNMIFNLEQSTKNDKTTFFRNFYTFDKVSELKNSNYTITAKCQIENVNKTEIISEPDTVNNFDLLLDYENHDLNHYVGFFAKLILLGNFPTGSVVFFYLINLLCLAYLFLTYDRFYKNNPRRLRIWYMLLCFQFWLVLGPWFFGKMVSQRVIYDQAKNINLIDKKSETIYGIVFSFGTFNFYKNVKKGGFEFYYQQDHSIYMIGCECLITFYVPVLFLNALFIWYAEHLDEIYEKSGIFKKKEEGNQLLSRSDTLETSILPDEAGLPETEIENSDDDILEDNNMPSSSSRRLESVEDETPILEPVDSQENLLASNNINNNIQVNSTSHHLKYIIFLVPFAIFQFFHCKQFYMMILSFGGYLWFCNPIGHFMTLVPLAMIFSNTQRHFYYFYKKKSLPSVEGN